LTFSKQVREERTERGAMNLYVYGRGGSILYTREFAGKNSKLISSLAKSAAAAKRGGGGGSSDDRRVVESERRMSEKSLKILKENVLKEEMEKEALEGEKKKLIYGMLFSLQVWVVHVSSSAAAGSSQRW
jgi:hypothetical protein